MLPGLLYPQSIEHDPQLFQWEKYFSRLEGINMEPLNHKAIINKLGEKYFAGVEQDYWDNGQINEILTMALEDDNEAIRITAIYIIKQLGIAELNFQLLKRLSEESKVEVKKRIIWALGFLGDSNVILPLTQMLNKEVNSDLQAMLALALGRLGGKGDEISPLVFLAANSPYIMVRCSAMLGAGRLRVQEAIPVLEEALKHPSKEVRFSAI